MSSEPRQSLKEKYLIRAAQGVPSGLNAPTFENGTSAISRDIPKLRSRLVDSELYRQNLERRRIEAERQADAGPPKHPGGWSHKTTKHQGVTESRGTILNKMRVINQPPPEVSRPEKEQEDAKLQVQQRKQQAAFGTFKNRIFDGKVDYCDTTVSTKFNKPALGESHAAMFAPSHSTSFPAINRMSPVP
jgi:hypothetical protein